MRSILPGEAKSKCAYCGEPLEADDVSCRACGLAPRPAPLDGKASGNDLYLMLVTANVLRLRRQYDLAEAQCGEVLRRDPRNPAAHSILGDIARDRGKIRDAIHWYKMALDLDPGNVSDRKKLEAVIDQVYPPDKPKVLDRVRDDVRDQLGSAAAEIREVRLPWAMLVTLGAMLAAILLVTVLVLVMGRGVPPATVSTGSEGPSGGFMSEAAPQGGPSPAESPLPTPAPAGPRFAEDVGPLETALGEELGRQARLLDPNCQVADVEIDPRDGRVTLRISMPRVWSAQDTRDGIVRVATPLAATAADWDDRIAGVRVRCYARQRGQPEQLAFVADASAAALVGAEVDTAGQPAEQVFESVWWDPQLASVTGPPTPPGAGDG